MKYKKYEGGNITWTNSDFIASIILCYYSISEQTSWLHAYLIDRGVRPNMSV